MRIDKQLINSIIAKTLASDNASLLMNFEDLFQLLNEKETAYIKDLVSQKPSHFGNKEKFKGIDPPPPNMVSIKGQVVTYGNKVHIIETQYLPSHIYDAFSRLRKAHKNDTGRDIFVGSGYRSPAYQALNFIKWLKYYSYNFRKTLGFVSIPGYSEHSSPNQTAIDFMNQDGIECFDTPPFGRFDETPEYFWLQIHAGEYGFIMTCTEDNDMGFNYEPWHWQYQGSTE